MKTAEGISGIKPKIKKIDFNIRGKMSVSLEDGRIILVPINYFPSIKKLSAQQRRKYYLPDREVIMFDDCDEVFHVEQILGRYEDYRYKFV
ncbi:MAG: DUF2442 domain-containing protein [Bacteroidia bacterium]